MSTPNSFYVYVYIDPRNYEEFYFGKGTGSRKESHRRDTSDSAKSQRIAAIQKAGLEPIIRVVASNLSEQEAFLIEKTLLWKLGKSLTNISSGHFQDKFRPHDTLHSELSDFDFETGIYFFNVGDGDTRKWEDYTRLGFISAGQHPKYRDAICKFKVGDVLAAYLNKRGYVGIAKVTTSARRINEIRIKGRPLLEQVYQGMRKNSESAENSEYVALVTWHRFVERDKAINGANLFKARGLVRASMDNQETTIDFLAVKFDIDLRMLAR